MIEILMDCHEKELMNLKPCNAGTVPYVRGLIDRGMLTTKSYVTEKGKKFTGLYVTPLAKKLLSSL